MENQLELKAILLFKLERLSSFWSCRYEKTMVIIGNEDKPDEDLHEIFLVAQCIGAIMKNNFFLHGNH